MNAAPPIIAAIDLSSNSKQVLQHAEMIAAATGAEVIVLHVVGGGRLRDWEHAMECKADIAPCLEETTRRLENLVAGTCKGVPWRAEVLVGRPKRVLVDSAKETGAGLLVMGAHDIANHRLGTVAAHCARTATCDVLILRDWQDRVFRRIAVCIDFSKSSETGLRRAILAARAHDASLEIVHVIFPPSRDPWGRTLEHRSDSPKSYEEEVRERAHKRLDDLLSGCAAELDTLDITKTFLEGESPAAAITAHVGAAEVDLTVMGSHEGSWLEEFVLGSNTERLLNDSATSVWITR